MSTTAFLLLSLLCVGSSEAHFRGFRASDGSEFYAKSFVDVLRNAIEHKEMNHVKEMISDSFLFIGCTKNVNKDQVLQILKNVPAGAQVDFQFKSSHFVDPKKIEYTVAINGLGINLKANFVIVAENSKWVLIGGNVPKCPKTYHHHHHHHSLMDSAETLAKSFLTGFVADIATREAAIIGKRFSDSFLLHGCHDVYNKDKAIALFTSVPAGVQATLNFESASFVNGGQDVQFNAMASGLGRPSFEVQFLMRKENGEYVLVGEKVLNCPKLYRFYAALADSAETLAKSFIAGFLADIATRDATIIGKRFSDSFLLHGCHDVYNKAKAIALFTSVPAGVQAALTFESASFVNGGEDIQFNAMASGLGRPTFEIEFLMRKENGEYVLVGEKALNCPKTHFFLATDGSEDVAKLFIESMVSLIASQDQAKLAAIFHKNFHFLGCKKMYNKQEVLAMIAMIPNDSKFTLTFKSSEWVKNGKMNMIKYSVVADGFGRPAFDAEFIIQRINGVYVLVQGSMEKCPKNFLLSAVDGSEQIAEPFVNSMATIIASKDQAQLAVLFAENFLFHGCRGDYDKATTLALFSKFPSSSQITLTFKSSEWINNKTGIQYNVVAEGFGRPAFEAQFILKSTDGTYILTGGKIPVCPKRRHFSQWY